MPVSLPCKTGLWLKTVIPVHVCVPASPQVGEMLDLHSTQGRGSRTTSLTLPRCLCVAVVSGRARACLYEHLSYPLVCIFVSKIKLLCSTRAKQSCVSKATIWGGGGGRGLRSVLRSLGSVGAVAAAPGQGWCWTGPANTACPGPPAPLVPAVTCRAVEGPPAPAFRASLLRAERRERPRSQHEHPQGLQHLGHRLPGGERGVGRRWGRAGRPGGPFAGWLSPPHAGCAFCSFPPCIIRCVVPVCLGFGSLCCLTPQKKG